MTGVTIRDNRIYDQETGVQKTGVYLGYLVRRSALTVVEDVTGHERSFRDEADAVEWLRRRRAELSDTS